MNCLVPRTSAAAYHADALTDMPTLSSTVARLIVNRSPLHAWTAHPRLNPDYEPDNRKTYDIGRAAHTLVLGVGDPIEVYPAEVLSANGAASTKAAKEWEAEVRAAGATPLKQDEADRVEAMAAKARATLRDLGIVLDAARSEMIAVADVDGAICRAMFDNVPADPRLPIYDFKTCEDASVNACIRAVMSYAYDFQAAFYRQVWLEATGEARNFRFVFQEKAEPHEITVIELSATDLQVAGDKVEMACTIWSRCLAANRWPGYPRGIHTVDLPEFYHARVLDLRDAQMAAAPKPAPDVLKRAAAWQAP